LSDPVLISAIELFELWAAGKWDADAKVPDDVKPLIAAAQRAVRRGREEESLKCRDLEQAVDVAADALARIVIQGDLAQDPLPLPESVGLAALYDAVNQSNQLLRDFVRSMKLTASELGSGSQLTYGLLEHNSQVLKEQARTAQYLANTLSGLKGTSLEIELSATSVAALSREAQSASLSGSSAVQDFSTLMSEVEKNAEAVAESVASLSKSVQQIDAVIKLITEVADRSDMLALNAGLEAARAGQAGRGFAIVADEMRRLSARVMGNTTEVAGLITAVRDATDHVRLRAGENIEVAASGHARAIAALENLGGILGAVHQTAEAAQHISLATQKQRSATADAAEAVTELSNEAQEVATGTENTRISAERLATLSVQMEHLVKRFSTGD
jgi:methyl-accepting chemotaxis protein